MSRSPKQPGIYRIRCSKTNGVYIGRSNDIPSRWRSHRRKLYGGTHTNDGLQESWNIYGPGILSFSIIKQARYFLPFWEWYYWRLELLNPLTVVYNEVKPSRSPKKWYMFWRER